jgi:putative glycosyltransferase (TIGR04348 family)
MRIDIVLPIAKVAATGNRTTAERLRRLFAGVHETHLRRRWTHGPADALIALHAVRSADSIMAFARRSAHARLVVVLTGTDIYGGDARRMPVLERSLEVAWRIVALQDDAAARVPARFQSKVRVIVQSAQLPPCARLVADRTQPEDAREVVALSHLREVKDPLLLAGAMERLSEDAGLHAVHIGGSLDEELARRCAARASARWRWIGERPRCVALRRLARARALVLTSRNEGGPSVLAEAALLGRPILATRVGGATGMLGPDHPGLFEVGDEAGLARLLDRLARDEGFVRVLAQRSRAMAARFAPERERAAWRALLAEPVGS